MQRRYKNTANGEGKHFTATYAASKAMEKQSCGGYKAHHTRACSGANTPTILTNKCLPKKGVPIEIFSCLTVGKPGAVNKADIPEHSVHCGTLLSKLSSFTKWKYRIILPSDFAQSSI